MSEWATSRPLTEMRDGMLGIRAAMLTVVACDHSKPKDVALTAALREAFAELERRDWPDDARVGFQMFMPEH